MGYELHPGMFDFGYSEPFRFLTEEGLKLYREALTSPAVAGNCYYSCLASRWHSGFTIWNTNIEIEKQRYLQENYWICPIKSLWIVWILLHQPNQMEHVFIKDSKNISCHPSRLWKGTIDRAQFNTFLQVPLWDEHRPSSSGSASKVDELWLGLVSDDVLIFPPI